LLAAGLAINHPPIKPTKRARIGIKNFITSRKKEQKQIASVGL
jgi:hypothetical protein